MLAPPLSAEDVRGLRLGEAVAISGIIHTARDTAHRYLLENRPAELGARLRGGVLYHCGPVVRRHKRKEGWKVVAAGPMASGRLEPHQDRIIAEYGIRLVIGKGGMGESMVQACREHGCAYLAAVGGAGALLAAAVVDVRGVDKLEFGTPEAIWEFEVRRFPAIVTIDAHGGSLQREVAERAERRFREIFGQ